MRARRDLYSADLALHVREDQGAWMLNTESARTGWCAVESLLEKAVSGVVQAAHEGPLAASLGLWKKWARDRAVLSQNGAGTEEDSGWCNPIVPAMVARDGKASVTGTRTPPGSLWAVWPISRGEVQEGHEDIVAARLR